jgi:hypothetical protein
MLKVKVRRVGNSLGAILPGEVAARLLDQLGLEAYLFEVEPGPEEWTLRVECAASDGWRVATIPFPKTDLMASSADPVTFSRLLDTCRGHLWDCSVQQRP